MKKKVISLLASSVLTLSLFSFTSSSTMAAKPQPQPQTQTKNYIIAYGQNLPNDYQTDIKNAGGIVVTVIPEIGGVQASSSNPNFLDQLKQSGKVIAANVQKVHKLVEAEPAAADGQAIQLKQDADGTYWSYQWDMKRLTNEKKSYEIETGGIKRVDGSVAHKAVVGVIDSGIDPGHPDLKANFLGGKNFVPKNGYFGDNPVEKGDPYNVTDTNGHGTHVSGSIAANGKVKGVGPDLGIRAYRIFDDTGSAPTAPIVAAIIQAAKDNVDIINMSLGGFDNLKYYYEGERYSDIADVLLWKRAIKYAVGRNVTVVTASGNDSLNYNDKKSLTDYMNVNYGYLGITFTGITIEVPGGTPGVINVSSSNEWSKNELAFYSNYGSGFIDVAAPGGDNGPLYHITRDLNERDFSFRTLSTYPRNLTYFTTEGKGYAFSHGTSMAAPKVAGIAGVIKAAHPEYSPAQVKALIQQASLDYGKVGNDLLYGSGEANAYTSLLAK